MSDKAIEDIIMRNQELTMQLAAAQEKLEAVEAEVVEVLADVLCRDDPKSWNNAVRLMVKLTPLTETEHEESPN